MKKTLLNRNHRHRAKAKMKNNNAVRPHKRKTGRTGSIHSKRLKNLGIAKGCRMP